MFTISLVAPKGGTGKSMVVVGLAVAAARAGYVTAVIDVDPQSTAANWKDRRQDDNPTVVAAQSSRLKPTLEAARANGVEYAFVDTAGRFDDSALNAARVSDLVLVPTRPYMAEVETLPQVKDLLRLAGNPIAFVVLNGIHPNAGVTSVADVHAAIRELYALAVCPVHLCTRGAYPEAFNAGATPQETDPDGKASDELNRLFQFVCDIVNNPRSEHVQGSHEGAPAGA